MKQSSIIILVTLLMSIVSIKVSAYDIAVKNSSGVTIYYKNSYDGSLSVTFCDNNTKYSGNVVIPETVEYNKTIYHVTSIGDKAFRSCSGLTSVTIPSSVTSIGDEAFWGCDGLSSIVFPENVTHIGSGAIPNSWYNNQPNGYLYIGKVFYKYKGEMPANTEVDIKDGTTEIADRAFVGCSGMTSVTIPRSVTYIGIYAFSQCTNLKAVNISDLAAWCNIKHYYSGNYSSDEDNHYPMSNPLYYANHLYVNGEEVTELAIPEGVTSIGRYAFVRCTNITSVIIPEGVTYIDEFAFEGCSGLVSVTIPKSITTIDHAAFRSCTGLTSVHISDLAAWCNIGFGLSPLYNMYGQSNPLSNAHHLFLNGKEVTDLIIPNGVTTIKKYAFHSCYSFNSATIPGSVTSIGDYAFFGCWGLINVSLPSSVTTIGINAFAETEWFDHYNGLMYLGSVAYKYIGNMPENTDLVIREGTTEINDEAFKTCYNLRSISIPNSVKKIGREAFMYSGLTSLTIGNGITDIGGNAFYGCNLTNINISDLEAWCKINNSSQGHIGGSYRLYLDEKEVTEIDVPNDITSINGFCSGCISLTSVRIPNSVTSIGSSAFSGCSSLISVTIPNSVTSIGSFAFQDCSSLTSVTIPNNVTSISQATFMDCTNLTTIIIPNSVNSIGDAAFRGSGIHSIWLGENVSYISETAFYDCEDLMEIIITSDHFPNYKPKTYKDGKTYKDSGWMLVDEMDCSFIIPQSVYEEGLPNYVKKFSTYSSIPMKIEIKKVGATSAVLELRPFEEILNMADDITTNTVTTLGQTPGGFIQWKLDKENYGIISVKNDKTLELVVQEPKALSTKKARLIATTIEADDLEHYGFEWREYGAPEGRPSNRVFAPLYNGRIIGTLNNLNPDKDYNYRPYYMSDDGTMFYGEWMWLYTGDADVYFEPEVYTKDAADITKVSALLAGVWFEGTDGFQEKGFEYWTVTGSKTRGVGSDVKKVVVSGNAMTATLEGLKAGATYGYRSYVKTTSGKTTYGEEKTFKTVLIGDVDGDGKLTNADADAIAKHVIGQTPTGFNKKMADLNDDGDVNVTDIVYLLNIIE